MRNWYDGTYKALLIAAIISFVIYFFSSGQSSLGALISGLVVLTFSLILILYTVLYNVIDGLKNVSFFQSIFTILNVLGPFLMMLFVICLFLYLLVVNKERIIKGAHPSPLSALRCGFFHSGIFIKVEKLLNEQIDWNN